MDCNHVTTNTCKNSAGTKKIRWYWQSLLGRRTVQVLRLFSSSAQRLWWQPCLVFLTLECMWEGENDLQQRWGPLAPRRQPWFPPQEDLAHPTRRGGGNQNTHPLDGWSSSHHLPVWSGIICQTPAAACSVLLGTLVIVLQPAWRMWDVVERKTIATLLAQIIWGLFFPLCS